MKRRVSKARSERWRVTPEAVARYLQILAESGGTYDGIELECESKYGLCSMVTDEALGEATGVWFLLASGDGECEALRAALREAAGLPELAPGDGV